MSALEEYEKWCAEADADGYGNSVPRELCQAAIESLKVCANCQNQRGPEEIGYCSTEDDWVETVMLVDPCHFTPSRWTPRD